jgi:hypothetical protein
MVILPNILLDASNYPNWVFRLEFFLKRQNLFGFVNDSITCPPQFDPSYDGPSVISTEYVAMSCVVDSSSSQAMWTNLRLRFASPNRYISFNLSQMCKN